MELTLKQIANPEDLRHDDPAEQLRLREELIQEQKYVNTVLPLVSNHHLLLVTLLLLNAIANEASPRDTRRYTLLSWFRVMQALPIFLDRLTPSPLCAVFVSVSRAGLG